MHAHIAAQVAAAQAGVKNPETELSVEATRVALGREVSFKLTGGRVTSVEISNTHPVEGPKLGGEVKQSGSPLLHPFGVKPRGTSDRR